MRLVTVPLGERSYRIAIGRGLCARAGAECARLGLAARCMVVSDRQVAAHYAPALLDSLRRAGFRPESLVIPPGEPSKCLEVFARCQEALAAARLERKSFVVALGGGVVGDLAGFLAATYLRGVPFVQVPTSLLAQVDSSVGGKVGVNLQAGKNLVGAFHQPRLVLCDLDTLNTLPERELRAGLSEVIKYGVIKDAALFRRLEREMPRLLARDPDALGAVVQRCCRIKAEVVTADETESGLRAILNFGHTVGHALEAISGYGRYLHGEAIAIGQVAAARLSAQLEGLDALAVDRVERLLAAAGLPTAVRLSPRQRERLVAAMRLDKKVSGGVIKFVLARRIGEALWGRPVAPEAVLQVLE